LSNSDFDRYAETFFDALHEGRDYEEVAKGYGEYYYDCLPEDLDAPILDVGCGAGQFLHFLELQGYRNAEGIELSVQQAELARKHVGYKVYVGDVGEHLAERAGSYAVITLNDVLEHVPKGNIVSFLETLRKGLREDGVLVVNVPQVAGLTTVFTRYNDFTHHLVFTELSLRRVLILAGFSEFRFVPENWPIKWTPRHMTYRFVRWVWHRLLRLIYFIELPGERAPSSWQTRLVAVAKP